MDQVQLKMNESKTEFIYFGGSRQLEKCITNTIYVNGEDIKWYNVTRYPGAYLDSTLSFKEHIEVKCKVGMLNLLRIRAARHLVEPSYLPLFSTIFAAIFCAHCS